MFVYRCWVQTVFVDCPDPVDVFCGGFSDLLRCDDELTGLPGVPLVIVQNDLR